MTCNCVDQYIFNINKYTHQVHEFFEYIIFKKKKICSSLSCVCTCMYMSCICICMNVVYMYVCHVHIIRVPSMVPVAHRICSKQWPTTLPLKRTFFFVCLSTNLCFASFILLC
jgi:hypothetical protein